MNFGSAWVLLFCALACGGEAFTSQALSVAPDAAHGAGDASNHPIGSGGRSVGPGDERATARDVLADPWPDDVVIEPAPDVHADRGCDWATGDNCPCVNCWAIDRSDGTTDHVICCTMAGGDDAGSAMNFCGDGGFPSPHHTYCPQCACHL